MFDPVAAPVLLPDSPLVADVCPSPNHGERRGRWKEQGPDLLLLHYTGMTAGRGMSAAERAIAWLVDPASEVSAHYVVDVDGRIIQLVAESRRAWHAGVSSWAGEADVNSASIGIEIVNPGHWWDLRRAPDLGGAAIGDGEDGDADFVDPHPGYLDFPEAQIAAVIALCREVVARHGLPADRVLGHSDVAPARKRDPGEKFPWRRLAAEGVGLAVEAPRAAIHGGAPVAGPGGRSPQIGALRQMLALWGYGIAPGDVFDPATRTVVEAFQRHYYPERLDGIADLATVEVLSQLIRRRRGGGGDGA